MKRIVLVSSLAVALACGSVDERPGCSASTDCPAGQYCARAEGESRCWPDAVAPNVSAVSASCSPAPCLRDGLLHVEATVADDHEVLDASVSLDLDAARSFPLARAGPVWAADVPLRSLPFDAFARDVVATVTARDGARNPSGSVAAPGVGVTRLRWERAIDPSAILAATPPAVMSDGSIVVGGTNGKLYFVAPDGTDAHLSLSVGSGSISAAPAVGQHAIWVGSEDGNLYAVELDGSAVIPNVGVNVAGPIRGSVAVRATAGKDVAFATCKQPDNTGWIGAASTVPTEDAVASAVDGFTGGAIVGADDRIHALTATGTNDGTLRTFTLSDNPFGLAASWTAPIGKGSLAPLALDGTGALIGPSDETIPQVKRTVPGVSPTTNAVGDLSAFALDSAVVLTNGDILVGDQSGRIHRFGGAGPVWSPAPNLASAVLAPVVLAETSAPFLVPTNAGKVFALGDDGQVRWEGTLPSATQLRAANLHTPPSQPPGPVMSTAYLSSGNGRLYAVVVDGRLDSAAPWPKAFHDPRNTSRAGPQP